MSGALVFEPDSARGLGEAAGVGSRFLIAFDRFEQFADATRVDVQFSRSCSAIVMARLFYALAARVG